MIISKPNNNNILKIYLINIFNKKYYIIIYLSHIIIKYIDLICFIAYIIYFYYNNYIAFLIL